MLFNDNDKVLFLFLLSHGILFNKGKTTEKKLGLESKKSLEKNLIYVSIFPFSKGTFEFTRSCFIRRH